MSVAPTEPPRPRPSRLRRHGALVAALAASLCACKQGEGSVVLALGSELRTPDEIDRVEMRALRAGKTVFEQHYRTPDEARLPGTLTFYDDDGKSLDDKLSVQIIGTGQGGKVRVERAARFSFVDGKRKVLQIRLERACVGVMCANDQTCVEGACKAPDVDADNLPDYASDEIAVANLPGPSGTPPKGGGAGAGGSAGAGGGAGAGGSAGAGGGAGGSSGNTSVAGAPQGGSSGMGGASGTGGASGMGGAGAAGVAGAAGAAGSPVGGAAGNATGGAAGQGGQAGQGGAGGEAGGQAGGGGAAGSSGNVSAGNGGTAGDGGASGAAGGGGTAGGAAGGGGTAGDGGAGGSSGNVSAGNAGAAGAAGSASTDQATIDLGGELACATAQSAVYCWGRNNSRITTDNKQHIFSTASKVAGTDGVTSVSIAAGHVCGVRNGAAVCWGVNYVGQLGIPLSGVEPPTEVPSLSGVVEVRAASSSTCARLSNGEVWCLGSNSNGQLGQGTADSGGPTPLKVPLPGDDPAVAIHASDLVCARLASGKVMCWGAGLLSPTSVPLVSDAVDVNVGAGGGILHIVHQTGALTRAEKQGQSLVTFGETPPTLARKVASSLGACIIATNDTVWCNRKGSWVQVGGVIAQPVEIASGSGPNYTDVFCVRTADGGARCWGDNDVGQVGNGKPEDRESPTQVPALAATFIATEVGATYALDASGALRSWGATVSPHGMVSTPTLHSLPGFFFESVRPAGSSTLYGVTLDGTPGYTANPPSGYLIDQGPGFVDARFAYIGPGNIAVGIKGSTFYAYAEQAGTYPSFGNDGQQVAADSVYTRQFPSEALVGLAHNASYGGTTCVFTAQQKMHCWGENGSGKLGAIGALVTAPVEITSPDGKGVKHAALSADYMCFVSGDGRVYCNGKNYYGTLGDAAAPDGAANEVILPFAATGVSVSKAAACAWQQGVATGPSVACWGSNELYNLGIGNKAEGIYGPTPLAITDVKTVAIAFEHGCALRTSGEVWCWGASYFGQLGLGEIGQYTDAQQVVGLP